MDVINDGPSLTVDQATATVLRICAQQNLQSVRAMLTCFQSFNQSASDIDWKSWSSPTSDHQHPVSALCHAEKAVASSDSNFGRQLLQYMLLHPDSAPVPSGQHLLAWLSVLFEEPNSEVAAEVYWTLRSGFDILPPGEPFHGPAVDNYGSAMEHPEIVDAEFDRLLSKGYVCQWHEFLRHHGLPPDTKPGVILPIGVLTKTENGRVKHRVLLDPSRENSDGVSLNDSARWASGELPTHYANIDYAAAAVNSAAWIWRADFEDSYMQIPLATASCHFAVVSCRDRLLVYTRGAYGHATLPRVQQTITVAIMRAAVRRMTNAGLPCGHPPDWDQTNVYNHPRPRHWGHKHHAIMGLLDDVAGFANSQRAATFGFLLYVWLCNFLGFKVSHKPGKTVPPSNDSMEYLGYIIMVQQETITLSEERIAALLAKLTALETKGWLSRTELQSLVGVFVFVTTVFGMRTYYRSLIRMLISASGTQRRLSITAEVRADITKWRQICSLLNNKTVMRGVRRVYCPYHAYTDASFSGWGWTWLYFV